MGIRSFLDRFVHPWVAAITTVGAVLWLVSFLVAATGLAFRTTDNTLLTVELFLTSGVIGVFGTAVVAACALYLAGIRAIQVARGRRG
jgi:hypothetical protein